MGKETNQHIGNKKGCTIMGCIAFKEAKFMYAIKKDRYICQENPKKKDLKKKRHKIEISKKIFKKVKNWKQLYIGG